jgi:hypothetical protein
MSTWRAEHPWCKVGNVHIFFTNMTIFFPFMLPTDIHKVFSQVYISVNFSLLLVSVSSNQRSPAYYTPSKKVYTKCQLIENLEIIILKLKNKTSSYQVRFQCNVL